MAQQIIRSIGSDGKEVLSNILDKDTGKLIEFKEVSEYYDGTPMSDGKLDTERYLYIKNNGKYYLRVLDNPDKFLEKDTMLDMRNISNTEILLLNMEYYKGVTLNGYYTKGDTPTPIEYYLSETTAEDDGGSVIDVGGVKLEHKFIGSSHVRYFGAKGDNETNDSLAFNNAHKALGIKGGEILIDAGDYVINNTVEVNNSLGVVFRGTCTQGVKIRVYELLEDSPAFYFNQGSSYSGLKNLELIEINKTTGTLRGKCTAIKYQDQIPSTTIPNWKGVLTDFRIFGFKVGLHFATANPLNGTTHAHLDGVSLSHGKFRNCITSILNENEQAVNINLINVDVENDTPSETFTMIEDRAGFTINIVGGSWIGRGQIYKAVRPIGGVSLFNLANINFEGTRFEVRATSVGDLISVPKNAWGTLVCEVTLSKCAFALSGQRVTLTEYVGKTNITVRDCIIFAGSFVIKQYPTTGLTGSIDTGGNMSFGKVVVDNSTNVYYEKQETSPYGTFDRDLTSEVIVKNTKGNSNGQFVLDTLNFMSLAFPDIHQRGSGVGIINPRLMVYNGDNPTVGFQSIKMRLPYYGTPTHLTLFKMPVRHLSPIEYKLYLVKDSTDWVNPTTFDVATDAILLCTTGSTENKSGYIEVPISWTNNYFNTSFYMQSGFGKWLEGRLYLEHSGSAENNAGFVGVKYI